MVSTLNNKPKLDWAHLHPLSKVGMGEPSVMKAAAAVQAVEDVERFCIRLRRKKEEMLKCKPMHAAQLGSHRRVPPLDD